MTTTDDQLALEEIDRESGLVPEHQGRATIVRAILDTLRILRDVRHERDVYQQIAVCAIHRLHHQHVQIRRCQMLIRRLCGELRELRSRRGA